MGPLDFLHSVEHIQVLRSRGPWDTKSGGELNVMFALPLLMVQDQYLRYDADEINAVPKDIRGLRMYTVRCLPKERVGGTEWHRVREEMVFGLEGSVRWMCEDAFGGKSEFVIDSSCGVWMPPYILHAYEVLEENSGLVVLANTLFNPEVKETHDTYSSDEFRKLQAAHMKR